MVQDGRFIVDVSPDNMTASGTFIPEVGEGLPLNMEIIESELRTSGVTSGVDWNVIRRNLEVCIAERKIIRDVLIAKGSLGRPAISETLLFHPKIQGLDPLFLPPEKRESAQMLGIESGAPAGSGGAMGPRPIAGNIDEHGNIDFREIHGLFIIHEGQVLAAQRPAIEGIAGQTVKGDYVAFKVLEAKNLEAGANTELREGKIYSLKNGRFAWNSHTFWVEEVLELAEDVGYRTGNIRFPGTLILKAGIKDRFKIWVGGDLTASGVVDAYEIYCGGNMEAKLGIIGRGKGLIRVKGDLTTRFIEHCEVESLGSVTIEHNSLNSQICTLGMVKTGDKGRILGGKMLAKGGIEVWQIGNEAGVRTEIGVGENYVMHRKLDYARDKYQTISLALQRINDRLKKSADPSLMHQKERLEEEAQRYQTMIVEILSEINDNEDAVLSVTGIIHPGVYIEVCRVPLLITKAQKGMRYRLHKELGKVVAEPIAPSKPK